MRGEGGLILVDPGIDGSELNQLADDLDGLGLPVVAGFSTHPHWDHLLWHPRFGDVPRYATPAGAHAASEARERGQRMAAESASGIPLELFGLVTPLPADGGPVPGEIVEHQAHAIGHAAVLLADRGVLLAGDMLSDVLIPLFDPRRPDQVGAYETALDRLGEAARRVDVLVPGHGAVAEGPEVAARLAADRAYIDALRRGEEPADARLGQDWLSGPHQSNLEQARPQPDELSASSRHGRHPLVARTAVSSAPSGTRVHRGGFRGSSPSGLTPARNARIGRSGRLGAQSHLFWLVLGARAGRWPAMQLRSRRQAGEQPGREHGDSRDPCITRQMTSPAARVIADEAWVKRLWAGLNSKRPASSARTPTTLNPARRK